MTLSASCCTHWISCSACKANFHVESRLCAICFFSGSVTGIL